MGRTCGRKGEVWVRERVFKSKVEDGGKETYAHMGNDGSGIRREKIAQGREMRVSTVAPKFVWGDEVGEKAMLAITDEIWLTGEKGKKWKVKKTRKARQT